MTVLYISLGVIVLLLSLYVLVFVRPNAKLPQNKNLLCSYAHRGLHSKDIPENSLKAFSLAAENGVGIELDVQLSRDGEVIVFHDYSLLRMTGEDKKVYDLNLEELKNLTLSDTDQKIPTFKEVLEFVGGRVPLLIELKGENLDTALCPKVYELLKDYKGDYCLESFNPFLIKGMKKYLPNAYYGQLHTNVCVEKQKYSIVNILLTLMFFNFLAKPNFIAYNQKYRNLLPVKLTTKLYKAPKFIWTAKGDDEIDMAKKLGEHPIFEIK